MSNEDTPIEEPTPQDQQSRWIQREVERLVTTNRLEDAYSMHLTDPTVTESISYDTFLARHIASDDECGLD